MPRRASVSAAVRPAMPVPSTRTGVWTREGKDFIFSCFGILRRRVRGLRTSVRLEPRLGKARDDIQRDVDRPCGVRQRAGRDEIDSGFRRGAGRFGGHAARSLDRDVAPRRLVEEMDVLHGLSNRGRRHVVQEHPLGARVERLMNLVERPRLRLEEEAVKAPVQIAKVSGAPRRLPRRAGAVRVVVLDEEAAGEPGPVIRPAAAAHGVPLEDAERRGRLPRVEKDRLRALRARRRTRGSASRCR